MDVGLILSVITACAVADALAWYRSPATTSDPPHAVGTWPLLVGALVGRMSSLLIDDPSSITSVRDLLAVRGGVDFWPGLVAGIAVLGVAARREHVAVATRLADVAPYGLAGAAGYQVTCFVREGCFGPGSVIGVRGIHDTVFPVEPAGAIVLVAVGIWLLNGRRRQAAGLTIVAAVSALALERAVVSVWLPVVGSGLSRAHVSSIVVAALGVPTLAVMGLRSRSHLVTAARGSS